MKPQLVIIQGPGSGRAFELPAGAGMLIGRGPSSDLRLADPRVSRSHCRIQANGDGEAYLVSDAGSTSGTLLNGQAVQRQRLQSGDVLQIGETRLRFECQGVPPHSTPAGTMFGRPKPRPPVTPLDQLVGQTLAHFHLEAIIARGVSGMVYRARDTQADRVAAVKVLSPEYAGTPPKQERFIHGIESMRPIRHENIVALHAAGFQSPYCWIAMEYIVGESLSQTIRRVSECRQPGWPFAFRVAVHIGRALEEAGRHQIVHRNVSPQNILIRATDGVALLGDLTLAEALTGTLSRQVTRTGELADDVAYLPPERTRDASSVDARSDIYGLGACLYAVLTGQPPFRASTLPALIHAIRQEAPADPQQYEPSIPDAFQQLVLRMLSKRPDERVPSPNALLQALKRVPAP